MPDRVITAEALISARDGTGDVFTRIAQKMGEIGKSAKASAEVERLSKSLADASKTAEKIGQFKVASKSLDAASLSMAQAKQKAAQLATQIAGMDKPTATMTGKLAQAEKEVTRTSEAFKRQGKAVREARSALAETGTPIAKLASEETRLRGVIESTSVALEKQIGVERRAAEMAEKVAAANKHRVASERQAERTMRAHGRHGGGLDIGGAVAGVLAGHSALQGAERVGERYREFDKERRYGGVVMGLNYDEQLPLIEQAIHGGATSKFNDIQWLESQRELAARGYDKSQVLAFTPVAAQIGQAFDVSMPEAVKALEGALLGFGKDTSTFEKAMEAAHRTADLEVKASKISGMGFEDVVQLYKYAAAPAKMAHLSEESMLAYGAISKKANMGGDESGVAFRALAKNLLTPTSGAQIAMQAAGIDFSKFQHAPDHLDTGGFVATVAKEFGIKLDAETRARLDKLFHDKATIGDAAKFMPAVQALLGQSLGGDDAKSKNKIAQKARAYRDASMESIDTNGLMAAIMEGIHKSPQLSNAIFGSKQGGRIYAALGDPGFYAHILDELKNQSQGFAGKVSAERMAGFDGAVSKLQGSIANLETAIGRAFDDGGKGGFLTTATEGAAHFVQILAEADPHILELGAAAVGLTGLWGSAKVVGMFTDGFGLKGAAFQLETAALHLQGVGSGVAGNAVNTAEKAVSGTAGAAGLMGRLALGLPIAGAGIFVTEAMLNRDQGKSLVDGGVPDTKPWDNNLGLPGTGEEAPSDPAAVGKRAAELGGGAKDAASGFFAWIASAAKAHGWGDRLQNERLGSVPGAFSTLPADAGDRASERNDAIRKFNEEIMNAAPVMGQLSDKSGVLQASFTTLDGGAGTLATDFGTVGTGASGLKGSLDILTQTAIGAARTLAMVAMSGAGGLDGAGSGIIKASFGGGGGFGGGRGYGGPPILGGGAAKGEEADFIRGLATKYGIDPRVAVAVAKSEGLGVAWGTGMDHGTSFGAYQLHVGGGLGDIYQRVTGKNPRDQHNWRDMDRFALEWASKHGWGDWHGAARIGVHGMYGIGRAPPHDEHPALKAPAQRKDSPAALHATTAALHALPGQIVAALEGSGSLHRIEVRAAGGATAEKTYSRRRGSMGPTMMVA